MNMKFMMINADIMKKYDANFPAIHPPIVEEVAIRASKEGDTLYHREGHPNSESSGQLFNPFRSQDARPVSVVCVSMPLSSKTIEATRSLFTSKYIKKLVLKDCMLSPATTYLLMEYLLEICPPPLKVLCFSGNPCGDLGAQALSKLIRSCHNLEHLSVSDASDTHEGFATIIAAISSVTSLRSLDLSRGHFTDRNGNSGGKSNLYNLARSISHHNQLTELVLSDCGLNREHVRELFFYLNDITFPELVSIDFTGNNFTFADVAPLAEDWSVRCAPHVKLKIDGDLE